MVNGPNISDCRSPQLFGLKLTALNAPRGRLIWTGTQISVLLLLVITLLPDAELLLRSASRRAVRRHR